VARARPILEQLCRRLEHVGGVGAGAAMKLAINLPLMVYWQVFGEALSLVRPYGVDSSRLIGIFTETSGGPNVLKHRGMATAAAMKGESEGTVTFDLDSMRKDLRTMVEEGKSLGRTLPMTTKVLEFYDAASKDGWGGRDIATLPAWWVDKGL
jgi:3-hydroxyisobutyrate dehydrogenase